jgi:hypothetical protein
MEKEKRRFSRVDFKLKAYVYCRDLSIKGEVENLSLKGMFVRTGEKLQPGDLVEATVYLSGTANPLDISVSIKGTVVRTEDGGMVLQFKEMDLDSFARLKNVIAYNDGNEDKVMEELVSAIDRGAD